MTKINLERSVEAHGRRLRLALAALLLLALLLAPAPPAAAHAPGELDPSFGGTGKVMAYFGGLSYSTGADVALQADGKIVVVGTASYGDFGVLRFNEDGTLDPSFGTDGKVSTDFARGAAATGVAIQADGKIVVAGHNSANFVVARYTTTGALDATFGTDGIARTDFGGQVDQATDVALQGGKIVVVGFSHPDAPEESDFAIIRYNGDGTPDLSFGTAGKRLVTFGESTVGDGAGESVDPIYGVAETAHAVGIQADGKIVMAGGSNGRYALVRLLVDGTLDNGFDGDGKVVTEILERDIAHGLVIQPDGKLVAAGESNGDFAVVRYQADGSLDGEFGSAGIVTTDFAGGHDGARDVVLDRWGRIVLGGYAQQERRDFALARYTPAGELDPSFGTCGKTTNHIADQDEIAGLAIDAEDRLVAAGYSVLVTLYAEIVVARYYGQIIQRGVQLTPAIAERGGRPGETVYYRLHVTNAGNATDTLHVESSGYTWPGHEGHTRPPLAAGAGYDFWVRVRIPPDAAIGASDTVTVRATSEGDPGVSASSTLITTARELSFAPYKRYLPVMDVGVATP